MTYIKKNINQRPPQLVQQNISKSEGGECLQRNIGLKTRYQTWSPNKPQGTFCKHMKMSRTKWTGRTSL